MNKTKFEQFWIRQKETDYDGFSDWRVFKEGVWLENVEAVSKCIHVIEYSAFEKLKNDNEILIEALKEIKCSGHSDMCITMKPIRPSYVCHTDIADEALKKIGES